MMPISVGGEGWFFLFVNFKSVISMKGILGLLLLLGGRVSGQYHVMLHITGGESHQPIAGASVMIKELNKGGISDSSGFVRLGGMDRGIYELQVTCRGYMGREIKLDLPLKEKDTVSVTLEQNVETLGDVVVSSSRTNGRIKDLPTRVEVLGTEDMEEETSMHPGNVAMLLSEASGIQTQQTSASSGNVQIRILGLDGKYTQLLKDGFPMYSGFSNGLSIMQIPPLDLKQVEVIKGSSSSLYGGDAIAGIINLISDQPKEKRELDLLINQTSLSGSDINGYYSKRWKKFGFSLLSANSLQLARDVNNDGFSDVPLTKSFAFNPKLFFYFTPTTSLQFAINTTFDDRKGGDMQVLKGKQDSAHQFFEEDISNRFSTQSKFEKQFERNQ